MAASVRAVIGGNPGSAVGTMLVGRYLLEAVIGIGGMSNVFRARDNVLERQVAVKLLRPELVGEEAQLDRFVREARMAAGLSHDNIVSVLDRGEDGGIPFIVFEFVEGENLKQLIERNGPLPVAQALGVAIGIARALAFAHETGYIHRDVKSQNVLVTARGLAKVTDFGIARSLNPSDAITEPGTVLGSADYISPEQAQGKSADEASDVYSLGVVLFELLTGEVPFRGESFVSVALQQVNQVPPHVRSLRSEVSPRVDSAVARSLAKDPAERFRTMGGFAQELEACRDEAAEADNSRSTHVIPAPLTRSAAGTRHVTRRRLIRGLAAFGLVAAVAAVALSADRDVGTQTPSARATASLGGSTPLHLRAVAPYDPPPGDGVEDNGRLRLATDANPATAWATEWYASPAFGNLKRGVGIVFDAGGIRRLSSLTVRSDTPGFVAIVKAGPSPSGPFIEASRAETVGDLTTFPIVTAVRERYYLLWITRLSATTGPDYRADVNEVTARARSAAA